jgi:hypothetical protein
MRGLDIGLHQQAHAEHAPIIILQAHNNIAQLLLSPQIIKGRLLNKGLRQILQQFGPDLKRLILKVHNY